MAPPLPDNRAYCQPPPGLRDRLLTDLDIKGMNACPDKVDIEAIRLVYAVNLNNRGTPHQSGSGAIVAGTANYGIFLATMNNLNPLETHGKLKSWWVHIEFDVAGRAAIVAAADAVVLRLLDTTAGPLEIVQYRCAPGIAAGSWALINFGSHITNRNLPTDLYPRNTIEVQWPGDYNLQRDTVIFAEITLLSAGNFPANTTINGYANWDSYV